jgi:hypothetical protein
LGIFRIWHGDNPISGTSIFLSMMPSQMESCVHTNYISNEKLFIAVFVCPIIFLNKLLNCQILTVVTMVTLFIHFENDPLLPDNLKDLIDHMLKVERETENEEQTGSKVVLYDVHYKQIIADVFAGEDKIN